MAADIKTIAKAILKQPWAQGAAPDLKQRIAAYVVFERREKEIDALMREITKQRAEAGVVEATVISRYSLPASVQSKMEAMVKRETGAREVVVHSVIDETVIGGMRLEFLGRELDMSVSTKLKLLKMKAQD